MTAYLVQGLLVGTLLGLRARGLHRRAWAFVAYALAVILLGSLAMAWPETFNTWEWWAFRQDLYGGLKVAIALEVAMYVVAAFPGAERAARRGAAFLLVLSTLFLLTRPGMYMTAYPRWAMSLNTVALWMFGLVGLIVVWYNLPLVPWHSRLLVGFILMTALDGGLAGVWRALGVDFARALDDARIRADVLFAAWWAWSAWAPERRPSDIRAPALGRIA